ncbi:MAG: HlyD family efflux transporter periplasmic adaptor subunit [Peptostreptococcales bacterium]|jgi:HlyD family secretion protein
MKTKMKMNRKVVILAVVVILILVIVFSVLSGGKNAYEEKASRVERGTIQDSLKETGIVFSKRVNKFYSDYSQKVEVIHVSVGDKVTKGDILLVYENNYDLEIERAYKQIEALKATYKDTLRAADLQEINMKLSMDTLENDLTFEKANFEKIKTLYGNNAVSEMAYKEAENAVITLENQLQEAKNNYDLRLAGGSVNVKEQYEAQMDEIMIQIKILEDKRAQSSLKAEFDGTITELNIHQGSMTEPGVPVVEIQDDGDLGIYVEALTEDAMKISKGMPFWITFNEETKELEVCKVYPKAKATVSELGVEQKRVRIEADIISETDYKIGSEVDVSIILEERSDILLIPRDAIYEKNYKEFVTVLEGNNEIEREITTGLKNNEYAEILSGLKENEIVLIEY